MQVKHGQLYKLSNKSYYLREKLLRVIQGPTKNSDRIWRIKSNSELNKLIYLIENK